MLPNKPCLRCRNIHPRYGKIEFGRVDIPYNLIDYFPAFSSLKASADSGCALCGLLRQALQEKYSEEGIAEAEGEFREAYRTTWPGVASDHKVEIKDVQLCTEGDWVFGEREDLSQPEIDALTGVYRLEFTFGSYPPRRPGVNYSNWLCFSIYADADSPAAIDGRIGRRRPSKEALSGASLSLIAGWLSTCNNSHVRCPQREATMLPTRVIDVGRVGDSKGPCLVVTNGQKGRYVALSHCWGSLMESESGKHARTLKQNIEAMLMEIPMILLPQNFQDAITTVRKLDLRYLWIDALCIIQDDALDWAREAAKMGDVYGSAYLTIAATSAVSSTDGFLQRPQASTPIITMPFFSNEVKSDPDGKFYVAYRHKMDEESWYENIDFTKWNTRGWTFQEQLLSRRVLHFTQRQLFWECPTTDFSEENLPRRKRDYRPRWIADRTSTNQPVLGDSETDAVNDHIQEWYDLVTECVGDAVFNEYLTVSLNQSRYSVRNLSYELDIFPALSGLARTFRQSLGLTINDKNAYLAGLWRHDFCRGLLWRHAEFYDAMPHEKPTKTYLAPTWSWASMYGRVRFDSAQGRGNDNITARLIDATITPVAGDEMGALAAAEVTLMAKVVRIDEMRERGTNDLELTSFSKLVVCGGTVVGYAAYDPHGEAPSDDLWIMEIQAQRTEGPGKRRYHPTALVLQRSGLSTLQYKRVGCAILNRDQEGFFDACEYERITLV